MVKVQSAASRFASPEEATFVYQPLAGDGEIAARVVALEGGGLEGAAGVSMRNALEPGAPSVSLLLSRSGRLYFESRQTVGGSLVRRTLAPLLTAVWLRLERRGSVVTAFQSADGSQWAAVGSVTIPSAATAYAGMVAASQDSNEVITATLSEVRANRLATLSAGWSAVDIGSADMVGATDYRDGIFAVVNGSGSIADTADRFRYTYSRVSGNVEIVARVLAGGSTLTAEAGVMVRESLAAEAAHVTLALSQGVRVVKRRVATGLPLVPVSGGARSAPMWLKLVRRDAEITTFESVDGLTWKSVSADALNLPSSFFVGLSVAAGSASIRAAAFDQVTVRAIAGNRAPAVALVEPLEGARVSPGASVAISAAASDPDDRVEMVEFFIDGQRIGIDTATPYGAAWASAGTGTHVLKAVAVDSDGARTTSAPVTIEVWDQQSSTAPTTTSTSTGGTSTAGQTTTTDQGTVVTSPTTSGVSSWRLAFTPSPDHNSTVDRYMLRVFELSTGRLVVALDLGRPAVVGGDCTVDVTTSFAALPAGGYQAVVTAVDDATHLSSTGAAALFTR